MQKAEPRPSDQPVNGPHTNDDRSTSQLDPSSLLRLKAVVKVESDAVVRVLELFHDRNIVPRRIVAERVPMRGVAREVVHIEIEVALMDLTMDALRLIAAKIVQMPIALSTVITPATT